ncbi:platelet glycoprotein IX-like [Hyla sarda]|uniref:platelet glycoprotein IX-like n=1 Tax=Hyla sarda TaxID=327740 RepID=UPI0024C387C8|nr:platelet glycoprotein IX-like [Hyla sarda]XP_056384223.1 platelet glycoprotein IX-like [Hyla sarda]XP_056384224.1 platelet glycoprotein IX-like [Hyla sarda]XP_056384225.1 platelet glycoprotein IX-like [Hyla sarda]XP_056384227.1 platelet glycoprotein IX-like [Hyla sarda]
MAWNKISTYLQLLVLVQLCKCSIDSCPTPCSCFPLQTRGLIVNCSSRNLKDVPDLPVITVRLYLQNNLITSVSPGALDHLVSLQEVDVSSNPWNCDCQILYLKSWLDAIPLQRNAANLRCATPNTVSMKPFQNLTGNDMTSCRRTWPIKCRKFFVRDLYMIGLVVLVLILMSYVVRMARKLACRVAVTTAFQYKKALNESFKSK